MIAYIGSGSNLGDRKQNLARAAEALPPVVEVIKSSSIFETKPWGFADQPVFLNQVLKVRTNLDVLALLNYLKDIEKALGRKPTFRFGPRLIDLDILFYGQRVADLPGLSIPHPRLQERAFMLVPLAEIAPDLIHPVLKKTIKELLNEISVEGIRKYE